MSRAVWFYGTSTTYYALDVGIDLPEVIYTSEGTKYLHLPGVIVTENITGETRYLLSDGLGSVRHVVDETGTVVSYQEYDPYGNPIVEDVSGYGYTDEWWENDIGLLHLRARWYLPETGTFLSRDPVESEPPYQYVRGNVTNRVDPSGNQGEGVCHNWSGRMKKFCLEAENGNLEAIEGFYRTIVWRNWYEGLDISGEFLAHYLDGTGQPVDLKDFVYDVRTWILYESVETPYERIIYNRLYARFLKDDLLPALQNCIDTPIEATYSLLSQPPFSSDLRGSFGKHILQGHFKGTATNYGNGFKADIQSRFTINDYYDFHRGLGITVNKDLGLGMIGFVPHEWLILLQDEGMAAEFEMNASWDERLVLFSSLKAITDFYLGDQLDFPGIPGATTLIVDGWSW